MVGMLIDLTSFTSPVAVIFVLALVPISLLARMLGVFLSMTNKKYTRNDKLFVSLSFIPKGTTTGAAMIVGMAFYPPEIITVLGLVAAIVIMITIPLAEFVMPRLKDRVIFKEGKGQVLEGH